MKAFVTGSTGLLGSNLVNELVARGYEVKALARSAEKARKQIGNPNVQIVVGDMENIAGFAPELAGCDVLFHTAAYFREYFGLGDHWAKLEQININGTLELLAEAEKRGVGKVIYTSSSGVLGAGANGAPADESTGPDASVHANLYFKSKLLAEHAIADFLKTHALPIVLILPVVMVGPQDAAPTGIGQSIIQVLERKFPVIPPGGFAFVDARDVATAMVNAVQRGKSGERYIIANRFLSIAQMAQHVGLASGVPIPRRVMPYPLMLTFARLAELGARFTGREPQITANIVRTLNDQRTVSNAKARRELGVTMRPLEETFHDEVMWFYANGYVKGTAPAAQPA